MEARFPHAVSSWAGDGDSELRLAYEVDENEPFTARMHFHRALLLFQPGIRKTIGLDLGGGVVYRPLLSENVVITAGVTGLLPGAAFEDIFTSTCATGVCGSGNRKLWNAFAVVKLTY